MQSTGRTVSRSPRSTRRSCITVRFLFLVIALALSAVSGIPALLATAAPFIIGILYSFRLLPERFGYQRLKEIPAVKNISVGLAWGILLSLLPVFFWHREPGAATADNIPAFLYLGFHGFDDPGYAGQGRRCRSPGSGPSRSSLGRSGQRAS